MALAGPDTTPTGTAIAPLEGETRLANLRQLTFGGQNAEAYFSHDGKELVFQSTRDELQCDAIFRMRSDGSQVRQVSSGKGVTTCAFKSTNLSFPAAAMSTPHYPTHATPPH